MPRDIAQDKAGEEVWDGSHGVLDVAMESVPQWGVNEAACMGTMLGMGALARMLPSQVECPGSVSIPLGWAGIKT